MRPEPFVYEVKVGFNRQAGKLIGVLVVFFVVSLVFGKPPWLRICELCIFGGLALLMLASVLTRKAVLRLDASGVTLCKNPLSSKSTMVYPWAEIEKIVTWEPQIEKLAVWRRRKTKVIGVQRRDRVTPVRGGKLGQVLAQSSLAVIAPGVPLDVAATGVTATTWALDYERLTQAVGHFAPNVEVADSATGRILYPPDHCRSC